MKKLWKTILILLLIVFLFLLWLFIVRAKRSNELKSWLLIEDSNWIIHQVVWGWSDLSINVNWPQTALRIPISSVVPETLTWKNFKFRLNLYDENWEKLDYVFLGEKGIPSWVSHSPVVDLIFKDSILWMKEFKMPLWAISRMNEDTFQVELEDFDWYADMAWDDIRYKILGKWKIDSVYLEIFHWNNVKLEFAIIDEILDEPKVEEDYIPVEEWTKALKGNPWERANKENVYPTEWLKTLDTWFWVYPYWKFSSKTRDTLIYFESESEYWTISRYAIYDRENHKRIFDCFDWWGGGYIQVDDSININTVDIEKCIDKYNEVMNILNSVQQDGIESQQPELSEIEKLKQSFTWTLIDWTNLGIVEITQDNTLYFNDKFWFAVVLWKELNWWKIEVKTHNEQFWENAISWSIAFTKKWFDYENYILSIDKNERYDSMKKHEEFWTEEDYEKSTKWRNNKYYFIGNVGGFISHSMDTSEELDTNLFPYWFIFYNVE